MAEDRCFRAAAYRAEGKSFQEIASLMGREDDPSRPISITRAQRLVYSAVTRIRHKLKDHPLYDWAVRYGSGSGW